MNAFDDVRAAVAQAKEQFAATDSVATNMAGLLAGRLRQVWRPEHLSALKRDLAAYNIQTGRWKDKP